MKKIFVLALAGATLIACNEGAPSINEDTRDNSAVTETPPPATDAVYMPGEGDVTYRDSKLHVMTNGAWVEAKEDVKFDNGTTITKSGEVRKDGKDMQLEDGVVINREGNFFDKAGQKIENAWDATKDGAKKAGNEIEKGAEKAGDAVDGDHHADDAK